MATNHFSAPKVLMLCALAVLICWHLLPALRTETDPNGSSPLAVHSTEITEIDREPRIALTTFVTYQQSYLYLSLQNKFHYTRLHGYDLVVDYDSNSSRGTTWLKLDMIERLIKSGKYDWVWWLDFDTLFTNTTVKVTDIIRESLASATHPHNIDFLLTNDCNRLNDGSFLVRSSPRSIEFLDKIRALWDHRKAHKIDPLPNDQEAMRDLLDEDPSLMNNVMFIPQWKINAFPEEIGCRDDFDRKWDESMLLVHFAGAWAHVQEEDPTGFLMKKYEPFIQWGQLPDPAS